MRSEGLILVYYAKNFHTFHHTERALIGKQTYESCALAHQTEQN